MPAPSLCVISGVVYDENGVPAVGVTLYLTKVLLNGVLIGTAPIGTANIPGPSGDHPVQYIEAITSIAGGVVSFTVPQLSTVYLEGNVSGYNNGEVALSIPATATSTLEALTPATFPIDVTTFTFLSLVDTPDDFTGHGLKNVRVNAAGTALEFAAASAVVTAEEIQDALVSFFPDVAPFDWTYDDAGDRVTLAILDATASARGLMSTAYATRLDQLETTDAPTFAGLSFAGDVNLERDAANILALRRTTNPQTFRIYNTFTDTSNYERAELLWTGNQLWIDTRKGGTGINRDIVISAAAALFLGSNAASPQWQVSTGGHILAMTNNSFNIGASGASSPQNIYVGTSYFVGATKVIGAQGAAVADATDNPSAITQLNALLARLRAHGIIAT